jgi:hypothetical protein
MNKPKRPALLDIDSFLVKSATARAEEPAPSAEPELEIEAAPRVTKPAKPAEPPPAEMFRTSVYFPRVVHDKLREIAFAERKSVTDLINEGLDHVLTSRNYAPTAELRGKKR